MDRPFRVLFVCLGNAIRSQMAEGFARCYGADIIVAQGYEAGGHTGEVSTMVLVRAPQLSVA